MSNRQTRFDAMVTAKKCTFDPETFLATAGEGREIVVLHRRDRVFSQGDASDGVFFVQEGKVKLTVVSRKGKEAILAMLGTGEFFGEGCLSGQSLRITTAIAITDCCLLRLGMKAMMRALHQEPSFSDVFMNYLLKQDIRREEALVDQLFNSSEKRLARVLLLLAQFGKDGKPETIIPNLSQQTLAEMVGTTRPRVNFYMNKFKKLGFIDYEGGLQVRSSLLNVVLHD
jgi:CRP/FNR family cyclic AMP-dependent transcriptional regulator